MKTTKEKIEVMQAFEEGKKVERKPITGYAIGWTRSESPQWDWAYYDYRVADEPKLRPWKPEEVPVGAVIKENNNKSYRWLIIFVGTYSVAMGAGHENMSLEHLVGPNWLYSLDHGKTWLPCGVEE